MTKQSYLNHLQWGLVLSEAWCSNDFRQKLERDPTGTIKAYARDRLGVDLEHVFQMPPPPMDLGMEALRNTGRPDSHAGGAPGSITGSGTAPSAPGSITGSGTAPNTSAPGSITGSGTAPSAPGSITGSGTSGPSGSNNS